jgi:hypothetical protein
VVPLRLGLVQSGEDLQLRHFAALIWLQITGSRSSLHTLC